MRRSMRTRPSRPYQSWQRSQLSHSDRLHGDASGSSHLLRRYTARFCINPLTVVRTGVPDRGPPAAKETLHLVRTRQPSATVSLICCAVFSSQRQTIVAPRAGELFRGSVQKIVNVRPVVLAKHERAAASVGRSGTGEARGCPKRSRSALLGGLGPAIPAPSPAIAMLHGGRAEASTLDSRRAVVRPSDARFLQTSPDDVGTTPWCRRGCRCNVTSAPSSRR